MKVNTIVSDALLKQLSSETSKVGRQVNVRETRFLPSVSAFITNVIILPQSEFYRNKFMALYSRHEHNAVKALKELAIDFPYTPDYDLGLGFVIALHIPGQEVRQHAKVLLRHELELLPESSGPAPEQEEKKDDLRISG